MLEIGIEYLNGWALATHPSDRESPEWPPHPDRVFMALAAAHFETDGEADEKEILRWLETLGDPTVVSSACDARSTVTTYVPVNDNASPINKKNKPLMTAGSLPIGRDRQPRTFPIAVPKDPIVYLQWDISPDSLQLERLNILCHKVTSVGHSASLVRMWAKESEASEVVTAGSRHDRLIPSTGGRYSLRVFSPGRLANLEAQYNKAAVEDHAMLQQELAQSNGKRKKEIKATIKERYGKSAPQSLRPTSGLWQGYDKAWQTQKVPAEVRTNWSPDLFILRKVDGRRCGLVTTLQLTEALRNTCMKQCPDPLPEWLSGHTQDGHPSERTQGHVAFLPLTHVGRSHADGHLLGLAIAIPRDVSPSELSRSFNPLLFDESGEPKEISLTLGKLGVWKLELIEDNDSRIALQPETWTAQLGPCRRWGTVTPIALDRHAKGKDPWEDICRIISEACERIGVPRPLEVIPSPVSVFEGAPTSREMPRLKRKRDNGKIRQIHAVLSFSDPVIGPIALGAGRYRGYGFCRPLTSGDLL